MGSRNYAGLIGLEIRRARQAGHFEELSEEQILEMSVGDMLDLISVSQAAVAADVAALMDGSRVDEANDPAQLAAAIPRSY